MNSTNMNEIKNTIITEGHYDKHTLSGGNLVPLLASAVTWSRGPRPWRRFAHGTLTISNFPFRVRPDQETSMATEWGGGVDTERGPDGV